VAVADGDADLLAPGPLQGWKINAPKMAVSISLKRLKNEARCDAVSHSGLDNLLWF
jgi:hypothetical protein